MRSRHNPLTEVDDTYSDESSLRSSPDLGGSPVEPPGPGSRVLRRVFGWGCILVAIALAVYCGYDLAQRPVSLSSAPSRPFALGRLLAPVLWPLPFLLLAYVLLRPTRGWGSRRRHGRHSR